MLQFYRTVSKGDLLQLYSLNLICLYAYLSCAFTHLYCVIFTSFLPLNEFDKLWTNLFLIFTRSYCTVQSVQMAFVLVYFVLILFLQSFLKAVFRSFSGALFWLYYNGEGNYSSVRPIQRRAPGRAACRASPETLIFILFNWPLGNSLKDPSHLIRFDQKWYSWIGLG